MLKKTKEKRELNILEYLFLETRFITMDVNGRFLYGNDIINHFYDLNAYEQALVLKALKVAYKKDPEANQYVIKLKHKKNKDRVTGVKVDTKINKSMGLIVLKMSVLARVYKSELISGITLYIIMLSFWWFLGMFIEQGNSFIGMMNYFMLNLLPFTLMFMITVMLKILAILGCYLFSCFLIAIPQKTVLVDEKRYRRFNYMPLILLVISAWFFLPISIVLLLICFKYFFMNHHLY